MRRWLGTLAIVGAAQPAWAGDLTAAVEAAGPFRSLRMAEAPQIPAWAYARAAKGEVATGLEAVDGSAAGKGWGVAVLDAPVEAVWMAINDESRQAGRMPVSVSAVVGGAAYAAPRQVFEYLPLPIVSDRWWVVDIAHNGPLYAASSGRMWELSWVDDPNAQQVVDASAYASQAASGVPVAFTRGAWLLIDAGEGRTLVEYYAWSDPGGSVPAGLASRFAGGAIRDTLKAAGALATESLALSRAPYRRPDGTPL